MKLNIKNYYSKVDNNLLLHQSIHIINLDTPGRENISPSEESLQVAFISLAKGKTFVPHKHLIHDRNMPMAQESWVVINGKVEVTYYDINDEILQKVTLNKGECTITYRGGHNYLALEENTHVYELKTGPYLGQIYDKEFIKLTKKD